MRSAQSGDCVLPPVGKEVRGQLQRDRGRTLGTMCTCEEIERGTHAFQAWKLGLVERWWTQDGKLGITIQDPPPESGRRIHLLYFTYSYPFCHVSEKLATSLFVLRYYEHLFLFSMLKLHVTSSRFCLYLLNMYHFTYTFSHAHTQAHTLNHTCTISTERNGDDHRSLVERGGRKAVLKTLHTHKKKNVRKKPIFTNLNKRFKHIELPAKLLDYFLRSKKSNINQLARILTSLDSFGSCSPAGDYICQARSLSSASTHHSNKTVQKFTGNSQNHSKIVRE